MTPASTRLTLFDVQLILGRALVDKAFLTRLTSGGQNVTDAVLQQLGYELDPAGTRPATGQEIIGTIARDPAFVAAASMASQYYDDNADGVIRPRCG